MIDGWFRCDDCLFVFDCCVGYLTVSCLGWLQFVVFVGGDFGCCMLVAWVG